MSFITVMRDSLARRRHASGLFLCHAPNQRVFEHFDRLCRESAGYVDWALIVDEGHLDAPRGDADRRHPSTVMPVRFAAARACGRLTDGAGMMDIAIMPRVLDAPEEFVWALEYDVDYSGDWRDLFARFARNRADVLTTTVLPRQNCADWALWATAGAPTEVQQTAWLRSFGPLMRLSRKFAAAYIEATNGGGWDGHYEFIIPTLGRHLGFRVEDLADPGRDRAPLYYNNPADETLSPGTFVWRPARSAYYHQNPLDFPEPDRLYHPVKPK